MHLEEAWKPVGSGLQRHRILPGHQGGTYDPRNVAYLTVREHIIAHYLLWRIHRRGYDQEAYRGMKGLDLKSYPSRLGMKHSAETRRKLSEAMKGKTHSAETRRKQGEARKGKKHSEEAKRKMSKARKGKKLGPRTKEQKLKISKALRGKKRGPMTEERKRKLSEAHKGKTHSTETRRKLSEAHKGKTWWNNGEQTTMAHVCPGSGWKRGRLSSQTI